MRTIPAVQRDAIISLYKSRSGLSRAEIAKQVSEQLGCSITRNSVIGVLYRAGYARPVSATMADRKRNAVAPTPRKRISYAEIKARRAARFGVAVPSLAPPPIMFEPPTPIPHIESRRVEFNNLQHNHCRFPLGGLLDPVEFFCGAEASAVYCAGHMSLAYQGKRREGPKFEPRPRSRFSL